MAVVKYSKRPDRARTSASGPPSTETQVTTLPRIRLALLLASLCAAPAAVLAQAMGGGGASSPNATLTTIDPAPPERGWQSLANLLESLKPGVDTRLHPAPSQYTDRIEALLNQGDNAAALELLEKRLAERQGQPGTDVQLEFQHARALAALGRKQEAIDIYAAMTKQFPELPEPWNNLAALYAESGDLDLAHEALTMALRADPDYAAAQANLGDLQLLMALRTYRQAESRGTPGAKAKVQELENLLKEKQPQ